MYFDTANPEMVNVVSTSPAADAAVERVATRLLASQGMHYASVRVVRGKHSWAQLRAWNRQLRKAIQQSGIRATDIVFTTPLSSQNKIVVAGVSEDVNAEVRGVVASSHVPPEAVSYRVMTQPRPTSNLQDALNPPYASGIRIQSNGFLMGWCTMGFNVRKLDKVYGFVTTWDGSEYFVTASHCTSTLFGTDEYDADGFGQPNGKGSIIAREQFDPRPMPSSPSNPDCDFDPQIDCRYSDAALIRYERNSDSGWPSVVVPPVGMTLFFPFNVVENRGAFNFVLEGQRVDFTGQKSGRHYGTVVVPCGKADENKLDPLTGEYVFTGVTVLCSVWAQGFEAEHGDSGSPVYAYYVNSGVEYDIAAGVLWSSAHDTYGPNKYFIFSPIGQVQRDLSGPGYPTAPDWVLTWDAGWCPGCPSDLTVNITGPPVIYETGTYTWEANPAGDTGIYSSYQWETQEVGYSNWFSRGTGQTQSLTLNDLAPADFRLRVTVTSSSGAQASSTFYVTNSIVSGGCVGEICPERVSGISVGASGN